MTVDTTPPATAPTPLAPPPVAVTDGVTNPAALELLYRTSINELRTALTEEARARSAIASRRTQLAQIEAETWLATKDDGTGAQIPAIDGKNAETRQAQHAGLLRENDLYANLTAFLQKAEEDRLIASVAVEIARELCTLRRELIRLWQQPHADRH